MLETQEKLKKIWQTLILEEAWLANRETQ